MNDWTNEIDYRDRPEFHKYRDEIRGLFAIHGRLSVPEIHRLVTEPIREWTMDVLDALELIEHGVQPVKYELYIPRTSTYDYSNRKIRFGPPADKTRPSVESFERGRA